MRLQKCANGHFYDADRFDECPHCRDEVIAPPVPVPPGGLPDEPHNAPYDPEYDDEPVIPFGAPSPFPTDPIRTQPLFPDLPVQRTRRPNDQIVETKPVSADVYLRGGIVRRAGSVTVNEGENTLYITGISATAVKDSIRLVPKAGGKRETVQVLDQIPPLQDAQAQFISPENREKTDQLKAGLKKKEKEKTRKREELSLWEMVRGKLFEAPQNLQEISGTLDEYSQRLFTLQQELEDLCEETDMLSSQIRELETPPAGKQLSLAQTCIYVKITADQAGVFSFFVEYREPRMGWRPVYEVEAISLADPVRILQQAKIWQATGETWENTAVKLFTNAPSVSTGYPDYRPVYLELAPKEPKPVFRPINRFAAPSASAYDDSFYSGASAYGQAERPTTAVGLPEASVRQNLQEFEMNGAGEDDAAASSQTAEYALSGAVTLESDYDGRLFDLRTIETPAGYCCYVYPRYSARGYLTAILPDAARFELLRGSADMYCENLYLGKSEINPDKIDGDYEILLGMDEQVRVQRKMMKKYHGAGERRGQEKTIYEFEITVTSAKHQAVNLIVMDQIPVSQDENITVNALNLSQGTFSEKTGGVRWEFPLTPGQVTTLTLAYEVVSPVKRQILTR